MQRFSFPRTGWSAYLAYNHHSGEFWPTGRP